MRRLVYPPGHGSNKPRHPSKRRCRQCHGTATRVEQYERPAAVLHLDGTIKRSVETVSVFWCNDHSGMR